MTNKDIEITVVALQKSIIEAGVPKDKRREELQAAVLDFIAVTNTWKETNNNGKQ
jgi:hypothetical protein